MLEETRPQGLVGGEDVVDDEVLDRSARSRRAQQLEGPVGVAGADGLGERSDLLPEAVRGAQPDDRAALAAGVTGDEVGEDGSGLDGGELVGVTDEDEPGGRAQRLEQACGERQGEHRRLVDDDDVVRQRVASVAAEAVAAVRPPAEQPVDRHGLDVAAETGPVRGREVLEGAEH